MSEDVAVMTTVGTVLADDSDLGANGNILFQLLEGDSTVFQVNTVPVVGPSGTQRFAGVLVNRRVCFLFIRSDCVPLRSFIFCRCLTMSR